MPAGIAILRSNLRKFLFLGQDPNLTCSHCQISLNWEYILFLWPNFPGMRVLMLVLMSDMFYLSINLVFFGGYLVVTARYLVVSAGYCSLPDGYCSLVVVTASYRSLLLVATFSMKVFNVSNNNTIIALIFISTAAVVTVVSLLLELKFWPEMKTKEKRTKTTAKQQQNHKQKETKTSISKKTP